MVLLQGNLFSSGFFCLGGGSDNGRSEGIEQMKVHDEDRALEDLVDFSGGWKSLLVSGGGQPNVQDRGVVEWLQIVEAFYLGRICLPNRLSYAAATVILLL